MPLFLMLGDVEYPAHRADGGKKSGVTQGQHHGAMSAHGQSGHGPFFCIRGEKTINGGYQFLDEIGLDLTMRIGTAVGVPTKPFSIGTNDDDSKPGRQGLELFPAVRGPARIIIIRAMKKI
ncbi:MAG: hypothetical protein V1816_19080 [Pseudomonadota bacterium]